MTRFLIPLCVLLAGLLWLVGMFLFAKLDTFCGRLAT